MQDILSAFYQYIMITRLEMKKIFLKNVQRSNTLTCNQTHIMSLYWILQNVEIDDKRVLETG